MAVVVCPQCHRPVSSDQHRCFCGAVLKREELITPEAHRRRTLGRLLRIDFAAYSAGAAMIPWMVQAFSPPGGFAGLLESCLSIIIAAVIWWFRLGHLAAALSYGVPMIALTSLLGVVGPQSAAAWLALIVAGMGLSMWACGRREMS